MKITYLGNHSHSHCTEVHLSATFEHMGHEVTRLQEDQTTLDDIEAAGSESDLLVYTRTWGLPDEATDVWRRIEARGCTTISYHLDLWVGIARQAEVEARTPFWTTGWVFSPDGDPKSARWFEKHGIRHVWMPPAVYAPEAVIGRKRSQYARWPVSFVGSYRYHEEWPYREQLIDWLAGTYGRRFQRYGANATTVRGARLNDLYASTKVVVGDTLCPGFTKPNYWSDRVYETLGRGGFLIHPAVPGLEAHFAPDQLATYTYGDFDQLYDMVNHYLAHPDERAVLQRTGHEHVRDHHTYTHRLTTALGILADAGEIPHQLVPAP